MLGKIKAFIRAFFNIGESFQCPCCGKRVYFCGSDHKDQIQSIVYAKFMKHLQNINEFEDVFKDLKMTVTDLVDPLDEKPSLYQQVLRNAEQNQTGSE